jgi:hypothetical protein
MLYSGASSASFAEPKPDIRSDIKRAKSEDKKALSPASEIIMAELQKEINKLAVRDHAIVKSLIASGIPNALEIDELSNAMASDKLIAIKNRIASILRAK